VGTSLGKELFTTKTIPRLAEISNSEIQDNHHHLYIRLGRHVLPTPIVFFHRLVSAETSPVAEAVCHQSRRYVVIDFSIVHRLTIYFFLFLLFPNMKLGMKPQYS
jgi:hypothetical protein